MKKKILSLFMAALMVILMLPVQALANGTEGQATLNGDTNENGTVEVTFTVSDGTDSFYIPRVGPTFTTELKVPYFDLALYGLEGFYYNPDCYNYQPFQAGTAETAEGVVTVMHVIIYATEILMCQFTADEAGTGKGISDGGENVFNYIEWSPDQGAGSTFITGFWNRADDLERGFNFNYYLNYEYPIGTDGIGSTSDQQPVKDGDFVDIHLIVDTTAYGSEYQFFETSDGKINKATVSENESTEITLYKTISMYGQETASEVNPDVSVYYISENDYAGQPVTEWTGFGTTDANGKVSTPSNLTAGTYYISAAGEMNYESFNECASAAFVLEVKSSEPEGGNEGGDEGGNEGGDEPGDEKPEITTGIHGDTNNNRKVEVNMTISEGIDDFYTTENQTNFFYEQMSVPYFDLALYDLEAFYYNPDCYSGGTQQAGNKYTADGVVTSMHVFIYATEKYMLDLPENELGKGLHNDDLFKYVSWSQGAGSSYMEFWNGSKNLNYYLNYEYPLGRDGWGSTSDQQALSDGAKIDIHLIKSETASGSQYMLFEADGVKDYYEIDSGKSVTLTLKQTNSSFNGSSAPIIVPGRDVYYISARDYAGQPVGDNNWTKLGTTDENGQITVPFDLDSGTYYFSVKGEDNGSTERGPVAFVLKVKRAATDYTLGDVNGDGEIDSTDAVLVLKHTAGTLNNAEFITAAADVSGDGAADSTDAVLILKYTAGTITKFPAE